MFITGAFFAKQAGIANGLVDIVGGFLSGRYFSTGQTQANANAVVLVHCGPDDVNTTQSVRVSMLQPGTIEPVEIHRQEFAIAGYVNCVLLPFAFPVNGPGRYVFHFHVGASEPLATVGQDIYIDDMLAELF